MSPRDSDRRSGFTLLEGLVAMLVSGILIAAVGRFFMDATGAFNLQKNLMDRDQNAHYVIKRLSEILMQAGSNLPQSRYSVLKPAYSPSPNLDLIVNPRGGIQVIVVPLIGQSKIPVSDEKDFRGATMVVWEPADDAKTIRTVKIDTAANSGGFVKGIRSVANGLDTIRLAEQLTFNTGDILYAAAQEEYHLEGGNLMQGKMLVAQGIDSLSITYYSMDEKPTLKWADMRSARIRVNVRTTTHEKKLAKDGYRHISLSTALRFRNKL